MRGFGYVLLGIAVLVLLATFTIEVARNLSVLVLVTPVPFIAFSLLLMRVGRTKKEERTEEVFTTDEEQKGGEGERK